MAQRDAEGVLARWSRRKAAARSGTPESEPGAPPERQPDKRAGEREHAPAPQQTVVAPQLIPDLPDPDTLEASSDFKVFMQQGVPPDLRRRALRRLWRLDPTYSHHDGLDDCCGDFTDQARVVRGLRTAYRVGRGFLQELKAADKAAPPGVQPAGEASASGAAAAAGGGAATAAPSAGDGAEQPPGAGVPATAAAGAPAGDRPSGSPASREREPRRRRPLPPRS